MWNLCICALQAAFFLPLQPAETSPGTGALKWERRPLHLPPFSLSAPLLAREWEEKGEGRERPPGRQGWCCIDRVRTTVSRSQRAKAVKSCPNSSWEFLTETTGCAILYKCIKQPSAYKLSWQDKILEKQVRLQLGALLGDSNVIKSELCGNSIITATAVIVVDVDFYIPMLEFKYVYFLTLLITLQYLSLHWQHLWAFLG